MVASFYITYDIYMGTFVFFAKFTDESQTNHMQQTRKGTFRALE